MRPYLTRIARRTLAFPQVLAASRGAYCSICERALRSTGAIWDADAGETYSPLGHEPPRLDRSMLLCFNCERDQAASGPLDPSILALPVRDTTFVLGDSSPFVYEMAQLTVNVVDEVGGEVVEELDLAIVRATTDAAARTSNSFGIDFGSGRDREVTVSRQSWLSWADPRVRLRTEAWFMADEVGRRLAEGDRSVIDVLQLRKLVSRTGFVSVWATVLRNHVGVELIAQLVGAVDVEAPSEPPFAGLAASSRDPYPGTDWDSFFGTALSGGPVTPGL